MSLYKHKSLLKINPQLDEKKTTTDIQETITQINKLIVDDVKHTAPKLDVKTKPKSDVKYNSEKHDQMINQLMVVYPHINRERIIYAVVQSNCNEIQIYDYLDNCIIDHTKIIPKIQLFKSLSQCIMKVYTQITQKIMGINYENLVIAINKICSYDEQLIDLFLQYQRNNSLEHSEQLISNRHVTNSLDLEINKLKTEFELCASILHVSDVLGISIEEASKQITKYQSSTIAINQDCIRIFD